MNKFRHGDLLLRQIEQLPKGLKKLNHTVLAHGESGHKHVLVAEQKNLVQLYEDEQGRLYFQVDKPTLIAHEDHKDFYNYQTKTYTPPIVSTGIYVVGKEREFDYYLDTARRVID